MSQLTSIGLSIMRTSREVMDMSAKNIANINNVGYVAYTENNYNLQPGVATVVRQPEATADTNRLNDAIANAAASGAFNDAMKMIGDAAKTTNLEKTYSDFMAATHDLVQNPNDPVIQKTFAEAGKAFSTQLKTFESSMSSIKESLSNMRNLTQIQLENLQQAMSQITAGPVSDEAKQQLDAMQRQVMMLAKSVEGYTQVLNGVIPPITSMYTAARQAVVESSGGALNQDGSFNENVDYTKVKAEFDSQKFAKDMGVINAEIGSKILAATMMNNAAQSNLNSIQADFKNKYGVSLEEELTKISQYQNLYDIGAKLIKIDDELFGTLLDVMA